MQASSGDRANGPADAVQAAHGRFRVAGLVLAVGCIAVAGCTSTSSKKASIDPRYGVAPSPQVVGSGEPVPKGGGRYHVGKPYRIAGKWYKPLQDPSNFEATGTASWYGPGFHGRRTANGEVFDQHSLSAAHPTLPLPSYVRVTNTANGSSVIVRVNDRGPYHGRRVIDVSRRVAEILDFKRRGMGRVRVEYVGLAPIEGSDTATLVATYRKAGQGPAPMPGTAPAPVQPRELMIASKSPSAARAQPAGRQAAPVLRSTERGAVRVSPVAPRLPAAVAPAPAVAEPPVAPDVGAIEIAGMPRPRPAVTMMVASLDPSLLPPAAAPAMPAAPAPVPQAVVEPVALGAEPVMPAYGAAAAAAASLGLAPRVPVPNPNGPTSIDDLLASPPPPEPQPAVAILPTASFSPAAETTTGGVVIGRFVAPTRAPAGAPRTR